MDLETLRRRPALVVLVGLLIASILVPGAHQRYVFLGLATGGAYALIAVGYTMVYGIIELINFAHGEVYMFGAYLALTFAHSGPAKFSNAPEVERGFLFLAGFFGLVAGSFVLDALRYRRDLGAGPRGLAAAIAGGAFALATWYLAHHPVSSGLACLLALVWTALLGVVIEQVAYRPLRRAPRLAALITAIGVSLVLQNLAQWIWSASNQSVPDALLPTWMVVGMVDDATLAGMGALQAMQTHGVCLVAGSRITATQVFIMGTTVLLMAGLTFLIQKTRLGRAMRACAQDRDAAYLMGVDVDKVISWTFAIGSALGAAAGILVALYEFNLVPQMGYKAGVIAFSAAVLGGIGNIPGAMLGGIILGVAQSLAVYFDLSQWDIGISYAVMIAIILVQPEGLLGARTPKKS
jgi:branched-chain amino acid transport system permease protein